MVIIICALGLLSILLYGLNQGFSLINDNQSGTYENKDLGISFQYPSNWIKIDEEKMKEIAEFTKHSLDSQNLTSDERIIADSPPTAIFVSPDMNNPIGVILVNYTFPNAISMEKFNEITFKIIKTLSPNATLIENTNTTVSNSRANKAVINIDEGPTKGLYTSVTFLKGNRIIDLQLGPSNNENQSSLINNIANSITTNN